MQAHIRSTGKQLSVYEYPTLAVLIDDSQSFLDSLVFQLNPKLSCKVFHDSLTALAWLRQAPQGTIEINKRSIRVGFEEQTGSFEQRIATINIDRIYHIVTDPRRFETPSVLVVDYAMPRMNGLEFCQALQSLPCKKILLTGQADEKIAVHAFNQKLIDCFIRKSDLDAFEHLEAEITRLQKEFFIAQTGMLKDLLSRHSYSFLTDPAIVRVAEQLCKKYRFVEYYLFPHPTGILFFDGQGKPTLMVIETQASLIYHFEIAKDRDAPIELLTALLDAKLVPFFSDTGGSYSEELSLNWLSYCLPPQICQGWENYYWALFDLPPYYLPDRVYSYAEFLLDQSVGVNTNIASRYA